MAAETGVASVYSGGLTASGETALPSGMTAAHRSLPFGTLVRVTNLENGRSVVVRLNDRGPFAKNRIIDLSYTAAAKLDMLRDGTLADRSYFDREAGWIETILYRDGKPLAISYRLPEGER